LSAIERSLEERRVRFEEFFAAQRAALQREASAINQAAADQADFLERRVEAALAAKTSALDRAAQADKQVLMDELATWRAKAREHLPDLLEAQRKAAALEGANSRVADENRLLLQTKTTLTDELLKWRQEAQNDLPALLSTVRRALEAEENAAHLEAELALTQRRAEESLGELISAEIGQEKRREELLSLETALTAKLRDAEQDLFRQYDDWLEREAVLRRRDQDWRLEAEARHESVNALRAEVTAQRDELKKVIAAYRAKADTSRSKIDPAHGDAE
jgi:DNA repair exonuclease SbcCD ATPase subunit